MKVLAGLLLSVTCSFMLLETPSAQADELQLLNQIGRVLPLEDCGRYQQAALSLEQQAQEWSMHRRTRQKGEQAHMQATIQRLNQVSCEQSFYLNLMADHIRNLQDAQQAETSPATSVHGAEHERN